jgi:SAM-dependent methyltransferase
MGTRETHDPCEGIPVTTARVFEDEPSSMIHEQLARLKFIESRLSFDGRRVLDFGCGTGYNSYYLAERQSPAEVVGLDISEECIAFCRQHHAHLSTSYHVRDCLVHDPSLGEFDFVISCEVIEHVADQGRFLDVLARYLKPDGTAFITTPNRALFSLGKDVSLNATHVRELFFEEFRGLLEHRFVDVGIHSQVHRGDWHNAYINYRSFYHLDRSIRNELFGDGPRAKLTAKLSRVLFRTLLKPAILGSGSSSYPDVRERRFTDFDFAGGLDSRAVWFAAICSGPNHGSIPSSIAG